MYSFFMIFHYWNDICLFNECNIFFKLFYDPKNEQQ